MTVYDQKSKSLKGYLRCRDWKSENVSASLIENPKTEESSMEKSKNQAPIKVFRAGQVNASVWEREVEARGKKFMSQSVKLVKSYKDEKEDAWKETNNYNVNDLMKAVYCLTQAYWYVITMTKEIEDD